MSVKRTPRPLLTDRVEFEGDGPEEMAAFDEILQAATPRARITRIGKVLPDTAKRLESRLSEDDSADSALMDDIEVAEHEAYQTDLVRALAKEHNRRVNLPTAEERHERWREVAAEIREEKPYLTKKTDIARLVRQRLTRSHDPRDREFAMLSVDTIRKQI